MEDMVRFGLGLFLQNRGILKTTSQIAQEAIDEYIDEKYSHVPGLQRAHRATQK